MHQDVQQISFFRLTTGEDLISEYSNEGDRIVLKYPFKLIYSFLPNKSGAMTVSLIEWVFPSITDAQDFSILANNVTTQAVPSKVLIEYYNTVVKKLKNDERYSVHYPKSNEDISNFTEEDISSLESLEELLEALKMSAENNGNVKKRVN